MLGGDALLAQAGDPNDAAPRGVEAKPKPEAYPAHAEGIGAEYLVHSFNGGGTLHFAPNHLVVEVALYPKRGETLAVEQGQFALRLNGKKEQIGPEGPQFVAASLKYEDWQQRPNLTAGGSVGDVGVIVGQPRREPRFPGDPTERRLPDPRPKDDTRERLGVEPAQPAWHWAVHGALPDGPVRGPVAGHLFFPYKGKVAKLKSVELIWRGPEGERVVRLQ
jgi:hypothetical protein